MALHDLAAKIAGVPLYRWISDQYGDGDPDDSVFVYAAGGYYAPGKSDRDLQDEMRRFLDAGYDVVKMKIGGAPLAEDLRRIEAVLEVLDRDGSRLAVDVNGRFDLDTALEYARALDPYSLFWYEEVGDPLDYRLNATLSEHYKNPIATGENLFSLQDARNLVRYGGMRPDRDYIQVDPALSYGLVEYRRIQDMLPSTAGRLVAAFLTAATSSPCTSPPHSSSAVTSRTRVSSSPPADSPTTPSSKAAGSRSTTGLASASRARRTSSRSSASCTNRHGGQLRRSEDGRIPGLSQGLTVLAGVLRPSRDHISRYRRAESRASRSMSGVAGRANQLGYVVPGLRTASHRHSCRAGSAIPR